jgi:hypothetical protein
MITKARDMTQVIGHMPSKHEALGSNCSNARKTKREKEREIEREK